MNGVLKAPVVVLLLMLPDFFEGKQVKTSFHVVTRNDAIAPLKSVKNAFTPVKHITSKTLQSKHNVKGKGRDFLDYELGDNMPDEREDQDGETRQLVNFYNPNSGLNYMKVPPIHHPHSSDFAEAKYRYHYTPDDSENAYNEPHPDHHDDIYPANSDVVDAENTLSKYITPAVYEHAMGKPRINDKDSSLLGLSDTTSESTERVNTDKFMNRLKSLLRPLPKEMNHKYEPDYDEIMKGFHSSNKLVRTDKYFNNNNNLDTTDKVDRRDRPDFENKEPHHLSEDHDGYRKEETSEYHGPDRHPEESREFIHDFHNYNNDIPQHEHYHHDEPEYHHHEPRDYDSESHGLAESPRDYDTMSQEKHMFPDNDRGIDFKQHKFDSSYRENGLEHFGTDSGSHHFNDGHFGTESDSHHFNDGHFGTDSGSHPFNKDHFETDSDSHHFNDGHFGTDSGSRHFNKDHFETDSDSHHFNDGHFGPDSGSHHFHEGQNSEYPNYSHSEFDPNEKEHSYDRHYHEGPEHADSVAEEISYYKHQHEGSMNKDWGVGERSSLEESSHEGKASFEDRDKTSEQGPSSEQGPTSEQGSISERGPTSDRDSTSEQGPISERGPTSERDPISETDPSSDRDATSEQGPISEKGPTSELGPTKEYRSSYEDIGHADKRKTEGRGDKDNREFEKSNDMHDKQPSPIEIVQDSSGKLRPMTSNEEHSEQKR